MPNLLSARRTPSRATATEGAGIQPASANQPLCYAGADCPDQSPPAEAARAELEQLVRVLARQAARRHFRRRGYTILQVPVLLGASALALGAALLLIQFLGAR